MKKESKEFYTFNGIRVTELIKNGFTKMVNNVVKAQKKAHQMNSYYYVIYSENGEKGNHGEIKGYGIPK